MMSVFAYAAADLGVFLKAKGDEDLRSLSMSCFISQVVGGIGEPTIFGLMFRFRKVLVFTMIAQFVGGLLEGLMHVKVFMPPISNFLIFLGFIGGEGMGNMIAGMACGFITFAITLALILVFGYEGGLFERQTSQKADRA